MAAAKSAAALMALMALLNLMKKSSALSASAAPLKRYQRRATSDDASSNSARKTRKVSTPAYPKARKLSAPRTRPAVNSNNDSTGSFRPNQSHASTALKASQAAS